MSYVLKTARKCDCEACTSAYSAFVFDDVPDVDLSTHVEGRLVTVFHHAANMGFLGIQPNPLRHAPIDKQMPSD